jgi:phospholipase C
MALRHVKHFFVLMLENRSFDHVFGFSDIDGRDARTGVRRAVDGLTSTNLGALGQEIAGVRRPPFQMAINRPVLSLGDDIPHEFNDVARQLRDGFLNVSAPPRYGHLLDPIRCFAPEHLPVLNKLAREFVVCDRWFSSVPGPTFPNRMFAHAASSGGITGSLTTREVILRSTVAGFRFARGNIFNRLTSRGIPWAVYVYDRVENMTVLLDGVGPHDVKEFEASFAEDLRGSPLFAPQYVFIEPHYDVSHDYSRGNSMHPKNSVTAGESLVKEIYATLRSSPIWEKSVLIIVFDEHGGFYDHVAPPSAPAPGDGAHSDRDDFNFTKLGPRVPAIIVSPLIEKNLVDGTQYDHTSIIKTLSNRFPGLGYLTDRDRNANSLDHLFTLDQARKDTLESLPEPWKPQPPQHGSAEGDVSAMLAPSALPFVLAAAAEGDVSAMLAPSALPFVLAAAIVDAKREAPEKWEEIKARLHKLDWRDRVQVMDYVSEVRRKAGQSTLPR